MTQVKIMDLIRWGNQALSDQLRWFKAKGIKPTDKELNTYKAGFNAGWHDCRAILSFQGIIKTIDPKPEPVK